MSYCRVFRPPPMTHILDDDTGRTLCGKELGPDWETGEWWDTDAELEGVFCGCIRCNAAVEARAKKATTQDTRP